MKYYKSLHLIVLLLLGTTTIAQNNAEKVQTKFEKEFNKISIAYQVAYMNANCEILLPYLSEDLVIFENGEHWSYKMVKSYCPKLPVKPIISTERNYKILGDDLAYEFVSQMYKTNSGNTINETQAMIWKYNEFNWEIINYDISRYTIQNE